MKTTINMFKIRNREGYQCFNRLSELSTFRVGDIVTFNVSGELIHTELSRVIRPAGANTRCTGCFWYIPQGMPSCRGLSSEGNSLCLYLNCHAVFKPVTAVMEDL